MVEERVAWRIFINLKYGAEQAGWVLQGSRKVSMGLGFGRRSGKKLCSCNKMLFLRLVMVSKLGFGRILGMVRPLSRAMVKVAEVVVLQGERMLEFWF